MKTIILFRHAKSSWKLPLNDKDRPISHRGIQDAHRMGDRMADTLPKTFSLWSSTARRAKETAMIVAQNIHYPVESIHYQDDLYTFCENQLTEFIKNCDNKWDNLILFGHNDAITNFVNKFGDIYIENVTTAGMVALEFNIPKWSDLQPGNTRKVLFPRDLRNDSTHFALY